METCRFAGSGCGGPPFAFHQHPMLLVILDLTLAVLADVDSFLGFPVWPTELGEFQNLILVAVGAWNPVVALIAVFKTRFNPAAASDLWSRDHENLAAGERAGSRQRQVNWVAFAIDITWIRVHFIEE